MKPQELKAQRVTERAALEREEGNNNDEQKKLSVVEEAVVRESMMDQTIGSEAGSTGPEPFEPDLGKSSVGPDRRTVAFPSLDVRRHRRDERLRKKAELEDQIARMIMDSSMKVELAMEHDRNGK